MVYGIDYSFKKHFIAVKFTPVIGDKCYNLLNIKNKCIGVLNQQLVKYSGVVVRNYDCISVKDIDEYKRGVIGENKYNIKFVLYKPDYFYITEDPDDRLYQYYQLLVKNYFYNYNLIDQLEMKN